MLSAVSYALELRNRFRGITVREGLLVRGPAGWAEWSPFLDYSGAEIVPWLRAAREAGHGVPFHAWPEGLRSPDPEACRLFVRLTNALELCGYEPPEAEQRLYQTCMDAIGKEDKDE